MNNNNNSGIIQYLESVIIRFFSEDDQKHWQKRLDAIKKREKDDKLYLSVIGEFNSGKSTFINAFLRQRILKEAIRPTTASATYIEKSSKHEISLIAEFDSNNTISVTENDYVKIFEYIGKYSKVTNIYDVITLLTSEQSIAKHVKDLTITLPNKFIPSQIVIIDTPGFNPGDSVFENHFEVTKNVVENDADIALVLIPSTQAMSETLKNFLSTSLSKYLHRCVFVITQMDNIQLDQRDEVLNLVKAILKNELKVKNPIVFDESAWTMLPVRQIPPSKIDEWKMWQEKFKNFEHQLWSLLEQKKKLLYKSIYFHFL